MEVRIFDFLAERYFSFGLQNIVNLKLGLIN